MGDQDVRPIENSEKQSWVSVMFVWIGASISMSGIVSGVALIKSNTFHNSVLAGIIGYALVMVVAMLQGIQGSDTGLSTTALARKTFGSKGSRYIFSFILSVALIGWFGIQGGVAGRAIKGYLETFGIGGSLQLYTFIAGALMTLTTIFGFKSMKYLNYVAVPFMLIVIGIAGILAFKDGSVETLLSYKPAEEGPLVRSVAMIAGGFIVGGVIASDYTRYNKTRLDTLKANFFGIVPVGIFLKILGVSLAIFATSLGRDVSNITEVFGNYIKVGGVVFFMVLLASWTTNVGNAYSGGLAIANGLNLPKKHHNKAIILAGFLGTTLAVMGILSKITSFLVLLTALVTPIAGVMICDYWLVNKGRANKFLKGRIYPKLASLAWLGGCFPYIYFKHINVNNNIAPYLSFLGIFISVVIYFLGERALKERVISTLKKRRSCRVKGEVA